MLVYYIILIIYRYVYVCVYIYIHIICTLSYTTTYYSAGRPVGGGAGAETAGLRLDGGGQRKARQYIHANMYYDYHIDTKTLITNYYYYLAAPRARRPAQGPAS